MDEIDWIKHTKKALLILIIVFVVTAILGVIVTIYFCIKLMDFSIFMPFFKVMILLGIGFPIVLTIIYIVLNIIGKTMNSGQKVINFDKNYIREFPKNCSPALSSLMYNLKIDVYKDYTATILYLCLKNYLKLEKDNKNYSIKPGTNNDTSNLSECEKYVLDIIINKEKFDANIFKQKVVKEAQTRKLITNKKYGNTIRILILSIICLLLLIITYKINIVLYNIYLSILGLSLFGYILIINTVEIKHTNYARTREGKKLAIELKGLKNYIEEYTLIKDKEIDYIQILEDYIPYALALDEADVVEEFIKYNEEYRNLIYNRKSV